ncbi:MAG: UDP-N-acetylmuramoyl-L-alanyl-D-glutamate--2,6-diaminopimelate ligase [Burkholderiaceae bacterium]
MAGAPRHAVDAAQWLAQAAPGAAPTSDSRTLLPGEAFFAFPGDTADGRRYIADAIAKGARAVLYDPADFAWQSAWDVPHLAVDDLKRSAGWIAAAHYGQPDRDMRTVAVTGTNGKTSCAFWLATLLSRLHGSAAAIGTLGVGRFAGGALEAMDPPGYTTPDAVMLQRRIARLRDGGVRALAIEASSIGLDQGRMHGMHVDTALFTNLTRDHLDYHGDMAAYEAAKRRLFEIDGLRHAVINLDDPAGMRLAAELAGRAGGPRVIGYSQRDARCGDVPVLRASAVRATAAGTAFQVDSPFGAAQVRTRLIGDFNVANALGVLGVLLAQGVDWQDATAMIETLDPVPGRMQQTGGADAPLIVVDYAHTPDALDQALKTLRNVAGQRRGNLWCVFGCGGDRDPGKRGEMGSIATAADRIVVTSDNPRNEEPLAIIRGIVAGIEVRGYAVDAWQVIEDRASAILWTIRHAAREDVVLIAGKGHETTQEIRGRKLPFSDMEHAALALSARATMRETQR